MVAVESAGKEGDALGDCVLMRLALRGRMLEVVFLWPEFPTQFQADWWKTSRESCSVR